MDRRVSRDNVKGVGLNGNWISVGVWVVLEMSLGPTAMLDTVDCLKSLQCLSPAALNIGCLLCRCPATHYTGCVTVSLFSTSNRTQGWPGQGSGAGTLHAAAFSKFVNFHVLNFDLSWWPILVHWFLPFVVGAGGWLFGFLHCPSVVQITLSSVKLCLLLSEADWSMLDNCSAGTLFCIVVLHQQLFSFCLQICMSKVCCWCSGMSLSFVRK